MLQYNSNIGGGKNLVFFVLQVRISLTCHMRTVYMWSILEYGVMQAKKDILIGLIEKTLSKYKSMKTLTRVMESKP